MPRLRQIIIVSLVAGLVACRSNPFGDTDKTIEEFNLYTTDFAAQNDGGMKAALLQVIEGSRVTLNCAFSALTLSDVTNALINRARSGVQVKIAFDGDVRSNDPGSLALQASGAFTIVTVPLDGNQSQLLYGNTGAGVMRHNYCLADERYIYLSTAPPDATQMTMTPNVAIKVGTPQFGLARDFLRESNMFSQLLFGNGKAKTDFTTKFTARDQVIGAFWGPQESPLNVLAVELSEATSRVDFYSTAFLTTNSSNANLDVPQTLDRLEEAKGLPLGKYFSSQALFDSASKAYTLNNPAQYVNSNVRVGANIFVIDRGLTSAKAFIYTGALRSQGNSSDDSVLIELRGRNVADLVAAYLDRIGAASVVASNTGDTSVAGAVVINEINWAGSYSNATTSDADDDFLELYNTTASPINISKWAFACTTGANNLNTYFVMPSGAVIPAGGYFTVARKADGAFRNSAYFITTSTSIITPAVVECKLTNGPADPTPLPANYASVAGTVIDTAGDNATPFENSGNILGTNDSTGKIRRSMERKFPIAAGNVLTSWQSNFNALAQNTQIDSQFNQRTFGTPGAATSVPVPSVSLNRSLFFTTSAAHPNGIAKITAVNTAANTNISTLQDITVNASSTTDTTGITLTLRETGTNTGIFSSNTFGTNLNFTTAASTGNQLQVASGDTVTITLTQSGSTYTATARWYAQNLMINEIGSNCGGTTANDYIELLNPNSVAVSLEGMTLYRDAGSSTTACSIGPGNFTDSIALSGTLAAQGYALAGGSTYATGGGCPAPNFSAASSVTIDTSDCVALVLSGSGPTTPTDDEVVDFVGYGNTANAREGTAVATNMGGGNNQCISRAATGYDGNENVSDFVDETLSVCSPGAANPVAAFDLSTAVPNSNVTTLVLTFSRAPNATQAANIANYSITGSGGLSVSGAVASGNAVTLTTSAQTPGAAYTVTLSGISAAAGATAIGTNTANFFGYQAPGIFQIVEISVDGSADAVELRCTSAGSIGGFQLYVGSSLRYTFPAATFSVGDMIVYHAQATGSDETGGVAAGGLTTGFDFYANGTTAITATDNEIRLTNAGGTSQDYVPWVDGTFGSGQSARIETQITASQWTKSSGSVVEADLVDSTLDDGGLCLQRINTGAGTVHADTNSRSDWTAGTCALGTNQSVLAGAFNVTSASATTDATHVTVTFNRAPNMTQAVVASNYSITGGVTVSAAALSGNVVTLTTSTQGTGTGYTVTVTGVTGAVGGTTLATNNANFTGYMAAAILVINEVNSNITSCDLVELRVTQSGSVNGMVLKYNGNALPLIGGTGFPNLALNQNDYIVIHFNYTNTTCFNSAFVPPANETTISQLSQSTYVGTTPSNRTYDSAYDFFSTNTGMTHGVGTLQLETATGTIIDFVPLANLTSGTTGYAAGRATEVQNAVSAGHWNLTLSPADWACSSGTNCAATGAWTDNGANGSAIGGTTSNSMCRNSNLENNLKADWSTCTGTASWGANNPGQSNLP